MAMRVREGDYVVLVPESGGGYPSVVQVSRNGYVFYSVARANGVSIEGIVCAEGC